jgi:GNAT superfamily N-acetyltransferase
MRAMAREAKKGGPKAGNKSVKPAKRTAKRGVSEAPLTFRKNQPRDDAFLLNVTMAAMKKVYEQSTGVELTEEFVRESIKSSGTTVIIEQGGKPIGYYCYSVYRPGRMYWGSLILTQDARGKGIGGQINRHVEAEARGLGVGVIEGHVQVENKRAYEFWLKNGWHVVRQEGPGTLAIEKVL